MQYCLYKHLVKYCKLTFQRGNVLKSKRSGIIGNQMTLDKEPVKCIRNVCFSIQPTGNRRNFSYYIENIN